MENPKSVWLEMSPTRRGCKYDFKTFALWLYLVLSSWLRGAGPADNTLQSTPALLFSVRPAALACGATKQKLTSLQGAIKRCDFYLPLRRAFSAHGERWTHCGLIKYSMYVEGAGGVCAVLWFLAAACCGRRERGCRQMDRDTSFWF